MEEKLPPNRSMKQEAKHPREKNMKMEAGQLQDNDTENQVKLPRKQDTL